MNEYGRAFRLAFYLVVGLLLGGGCSYSYAQHQPGTPFSVIDAQGRFIGSYYSDPPRWRMPASWLAEPAGGGMSANGSGGVTLYNKAKIGGNGVSAVVNLAKNVNASGVAQVARVAARILGPVALVASVIDLVWDDETDQWMIASGDVDPWVWMGNWPGTGEAYQWTESRAGLCDEYARRRSAYYGWTFSHVTYCDVVDTVLKVAFQAPAGTSRGNYNVATKGGPQVVQADRVATDAELDTAIQSGLQQNPDLAPQVLTQSIQATGQVPVADPIVSSGPASIQGGQITSTTSGPAGTSTTTTNTNYSVTYGGPTVTVTENKSVTYTAPDGSQTVTNDTTTPSADSETHTQPEPPKPFCEENPEASGCAKLGGGTSPDPVPEQAVSVSQIVPENIGGSGGACPADRVVQTGYGPLTFSWSNLCAFASGIRPIVLAMAWLVAGFGFFFGAKRSQ